MSAESVTKRATIEIYRERYADCTNETAREWNRQSLILEQATSLERREDFARNSTIFTVDGPREIVEPFIHAAMALARGRGRKEGTA